MADLTNKSDVKAYLAITTTNQDTLIDSLITRESALIEQWCNRSFSTVTRTARRVDGSGSSMLSLPDAPIQAVTAVVDGVTSIPASDGNSYGFLWDDNLVYLVGGKFSKGRQNIAVSYTAGYANVPAPVAQACIEMVGLDLKQKGNLGVNSQTLEGQTVTYTDRGMTPSVKELLQPYRRMAPA